MTDYFKKFFDDNISSVFMCELHKPVSVELSPNKQVELIFEHGYVKDVNESTLEMYFGKDSHDKSKVINQKVTSLWKERDYKNESGSVFQFYKKFVENDYNLKNIESEAATPKGGKTWFLVSMKGIVENGYLLGWWGSQLDITKLKLAQNNLETTNKMLKNKIEETEGFAYISTHNLQTPLHNIQNFSSLLLKNYSSEINDRGKTSLNFIKDSANKLSFMLKRLVIYFELDNKHFTSEVDTKQIIEEIIQVHFKEQENKIYLSNLPVVLGDKEKLKILFRLLIENSFIHNQDNRNLMVKIDFEKLKDRTQFMIIDNGIGISKKDNSEIFKINKTDLDYTRGLGLAMAKKIVSQHDGKIWTTSIPNEETTFFFTIGIKNNR